MYKDKDKRRDKDRARQKRRRDKIKAKGVTNQGVTQGVTLTPDRDIRAGYDEAKMQPTCDEIVDILHARVLANPKVNLTPKRDKDIKCFADLPPDVQQTIDEMSDTPEEKARRTQAAIRYQWLFPNRFYGTGPWATGKPGDANYDGICTTKEPMPPGVIWESEPGAARKIEERLQGR